MHNTLWPVQQHAPSPQLFDPICVSPAKHCPSQKGAVPRHVSPLASGDSRHIMVAIAITFIDTARLRSTLLSTALFGETIWLVITLVMLSFPRDARATKLVNA